MKVASAHGGVAKPAADDTIDLALYSRTLGKNSPLNVLDWAEAGPIIQEAYEADQRGKQLSREAEQLTQRRDVLVGSFLNNFVRQARDVLTGVYRTQKRKLTDFGFDVADSPRTKKPAPETTVKAP